MSFYGQFRLDVKTFLLYAVTFRRDAYGLWVWDATLNFDNDKNSLDKIIKTPFTKLDSIIILEKFFISICIVWKRCLFLKCLQNVNFIVEMNLTVIHVILIKIKAIFSAYVCVF